MGIWNHRQPVTTALFDPDFDSRLKAWVTLLGYKPYHYVAVVEAPYPSKAACTSMWSTYKVFEPMQWMGIWGVVHTWVGQKLLNSYILRVSVIASYFHVSA